MVLLDTKHIVYSEFGVKHEMSFVIRHAGRHVIIIRKRGIQNLLFLICRQSRQCKHILNGKALT